MIGNITAKINAVWLLMIGNITSKINAVWLLMIGNITAKINAVWLLMIGNITAKILSSPDKLAKIRQLNLSTSMESGSLLI